MTYCDAKPECRSEQKLDRISGFYCSADRRLSGCKHSDVNALHRKRYNGRVLAAAPRALVGEIGGGNYSEDALGKLSLSAANDKTMPRFFSSAT